MGKITRWDKNNKIKFNENKSKAMLITRRKRKENKALAVYLNNKRLEQVQKIRHLWITIDSKKILEITFFTLHKSVQN